MDGYTFGWPLADVRFTPESGNRSLMACELGAEAARAGMSPNPSKATLKELQPPIAFIFLVGHSVQLVVLAETQPRTIEPQRSVQRTTHIGAACPDYGK